MFFLPHLPPLVLTEGLAHRGSDPLHDDPLHVKFFVSLQTESRINQKAHENIYLDDEEITRLIDENEPYQRVDDATLQSGEDRQCAQRPPVWSQSRT